MDNIDAFLAGIKPAIYENTDPRYTHYPSVHIQSDLYLFFQDESMKQRFINDTKDMTFRSLEFERVLGLTLGFPPKAVEYYVKVHQKQRNKGGTFGLELGLHYCGIDCLTSLYDLIDNVHWLWNTYNYPSTLEISVLREDESGMFVEMLQIPYQDINKLIEIQNELTKKEVIYT